VARSDRWADGISKRRTMSGETRTCVECGRRFLWSYESQRDFKARGFMAPTHCPTCRSQRRTEQHSGMRSEVGQLYDFPPERDQQPSPPRSQTPDRQLPQPLLLHRPARPPGRSPGAWWGLDMVSIAVFLWFVLVLITFRIVGWAAALAVVGLGVALSFWIMQRR
jgi:hypothetical protein